MSSAIVKRLKELKQTTYSQFSGDTIIDLLKKLTEFEEAGLWEVLALLDNQSLSESTFSCFEAVNDTRTVENFVVTYSSILLEKGADAAYRAAAQYLQEHARELSFSKICISIKIFSHLNFKTHEAVFYPLLTQFHYLVDSFYRIIYEDLLHKSGQLSETEQSVLLRVGYLKVSSSVISFIKNNKKVLENAPKFTPLKITDFLSFDGEAIVKFNKVAPGVLNMHGFIAFIGSLIGRLDYIDFQIESHRDKQSVHELLKFTDIKNVLKGYEDKITQDILGVLESESGYYQYRKYHLLSLRRDKIFNLHKNVVNKTDQEDEHLLPAKEVWNGYEGTYPIYLVRKYLIHDKSITAALSPSKVAKLVLHAISSVPENLYTGGEYFLDILGYLFEKLTWANFDVMPNYNQDNLFFGDVYIAMKRLDFNVRGKNKNKVTNAFTFLMSKVPTKQQKYLLLCKFLDMDYQETYFQTAGMSLGILIELQREIEASKFEAFTSPQLFLRKECLEKIWGHVSKADHKQLSIFREGLWIVLSTLKLLNEFNAGDWLAANDLRQFYLGLDPLAFDKIKQNLQTRCAECQEIDNRKRKGEFNAELDKIVDAEMLRSVKEEHEDLKCMIRFIDDLKILYMSK